MGKGKMIAQGAHASLDAALKFKEKDPVGFKTWVGNGAKKVTLKVKGLRELKRYESRARRRGLTTSVIRDAGHTQLKKGTITACAIGPDSDEVVDKITGDLKLL